MNRQCKSCSPLQAFIEKVLAKNNKLQNCPGNAEDVGAGCTASIVFACACVVVTLCTQTPFSTVFNELISFRNEAKRLLDLALGMNRIHHDRTSHQCIVGRQHNCRLVVPSQQQLQRDSLRSLSCWYKNLKKNVSHLHAHACTELVFTHLQIPYMQTNCGAQW